MAICHPLVHQRLVFKAPAAAEIDPVEVEVGTTEVGGGEAVVKTLRAAIKTLTDKSG
jgi:hypothetical protein